MSTLTLGNRKMKYLYLALSIVFTGCFTPKEDNESGSIGLLSGDSAEIQIISLEKRKRVTLSSKTKVSEVSEIWKEKQLVRLKEFPKFEYYIDGLEAERWMYNGSGYCAMLSKQKTAVYEIGDFKRFQELINFNANAEDL